MNKEEICFESASSMREKLIAEELTSEELTELFIERIQKLNPKINAYCTFTFDLAREAAKEADNLIHEGNQDLPLLCGIPISIKDLMEIEGYRTTFGSKLYEDYVSNTDEIAVKRLKEAGAVILGKTNTPAFGHIAVSHNLVFETTKNPWNLEKTSGGSSGGAGASVAAGLGPLALGSDGGGSIRIPSSFCGIFGLKPTFGRVPRNLHGTIGWATLDHYGPLTRYVEDAALMLEALWGPHPSDRFILPSPKTDLYHPLMEGELPKLKIGLSLDLGFVKAIDPEVEEGVSEAAKEFENMNWTVDPVKIKIRKPELAFNTIVTAGFAYDLQKEYKKQKEKIDDTLQKMIEAGLTYSALDVKRAEAKREEINTKIEQQFKKYDLLISPSTAVPAFDLGIMYPPKIAGKGVSPVAWMSYTYPLNMTGHPAASIPCGWTKERLPIGMQIIGKRFDELTVLQAAKAFQNLKPWQAEKPEWA